MDTPAEQSIRYLTVEATGQRALLDPVLEGHPVFLIGSDPRSHLQLIDPHIAPSHAVISRRGDTLAIAPRFPSLTVLVNGRPLRGAVLLTPDDTVQIGSTILRFGQQMMALPAGSIPQVRTPAASVVPQSLDRLPLRPALALSAPIPAAMVPGDIYFPQSKAASTGGLSGAFLGVLTVLGIVIALGFAIVQNTPGFLTPALAGEAVNPFAFRDGNITVLMFDAEW